MPSGGRDLQAEDDPLLGDMAHAAEGRGSEEGRLRGRDPPRQKGGGAHRLGRRARPGMAPRETGNSRAWAAPMSRIAEPEVAVSDGEDGRPRLVHKRLVKARRSLVRLVNAGTLFTYLVPRTHGGWPAPRDQQQHRGRRQRPAQSHARGTIGGSRSSAGPRRYSGGATCIHPTRCPPPRSCAPCRRTCSIAEIYGRMGERERLEGTIPRWGDAIVWSELHSSEPYRMDWD